jgi:hypothetical protein
MPNRRSASPVTELMMCAAPLAAAEIGRVVEGAAGRIVVKAA